MYLMSWDRKDKTGGQRVILPAVHSLSKLVSEPSNLLQRTESPESTESTEFPDHTLSHTYEVTGRDWPNVLSREPDVYSYKVPTVS